jgi:hypothetical protein
MGRGEWESGERPFADQGKPVASEEWLVGSARKSASSFLRSLGHSNDQAISAPQSQRHGGRWITQDTRQK